MKDLRYDDRRCGRGARCDARAGRYAATKEESKLERACANQGNKHNGDNRAPHVPAFNTFSSVRRRLASGRSTFRRSPRECRFHHEATFPETIKTDAASRTLIGSSVLRGCLTRRPRSPRLAEGA